MGNCKCVCGSCGHEMEMKGDSCGTCCDSTMEKVCEVDDDMDMEEESENGGGCCGSCH